MCKEP